jgi:hypothetical protein
LELDASGVKEMPERYTPVKDVIVMIFRRFLIPNYAGEGSIMRNLPLISRGLKKMCIKGRPPEGWLETQ